MYTAQTDIVQDYHVLQKSFRYLKPFRRGSLVHVTDRRTDGRTNRRTDGRQNRC